MKRLLLLILPSLLCIPGQAQEAFNRGFEGKNKVFIPGGSLGIGLSAAYSNNTVGDAAEGYTVLPSHVADIRGGWNSFGLHPYLEYFLGDNWSIGVRFDYTKNLFNLDNAALSLNNDLSLTISGYNYQRQSYMGAVAMRYYVPFLGSRIFGWFVEGGLSGGVVKCKNYTLEEDGAKHGTYQDNVRVALGLNPGICFFVAENFDFEVQVGLIDFSFNKVIQTENQVKESGAWRFNASEKIDLLAIRFGVHVYFDTRRP